MRWPVRSFGEHSLYHIGSLDAADKGSHGSSLEGAGLSVSMDPEAWEEIAELGGLAWWRLWRPGARFLEILSLDARQRRVIRAWALDQELITPVDVWKASRYDDEVEETYTLVLEDEEEAREEARGGRLRRGIAPAATPGLLSRMGWSARDRVVFGWDGAVLAFSEDVLGVDGAWWDERLDPGALSAPRGVIFAARLSEWERAPSSLQEVLHADPLEGVEVGWLEAARPQLRASRPGVTGVHAVG
jgi:hypothetical protein